MPAVNAGGARMAPLVLAPAAMSQRFMTHSEAVKTPQVGVTKVNPPPAISRTATTEKTQR